MVPSEHESHSRSTVGVGARVTYLPTSQMDHAVQMNLVLTLENLPGEHDVHTRAVVAVAGAVAS